MDPPQQAQPGAMVQDPLQAVLLWLLMAAAVLGQLRDFVQQGRLWWPFLIPMPYLPNFLTT
jgi:hypothetical protein